MFLLDNITNIRLGIHIHINILLILFQVQILIEYFLVKKFRPNLFLNCFERETTALTFCFYILFIIWIFFVAEDFIHIVIIRCLCLCRIGCRFGTSKGRSSGTIGYPGVYRYECAEGEEKGKVIEGMNDWGPSSISISHSIDTTHTTSTGMFTNCC